MPLQDSVFKLVLVWKVTRLVFEMVFEIPSARTLEEILVPVGNAGGMTPPTSTDLGYVSAT